MSLHLWLLFVAAAVALSLTPGPNGLLCLTQSVRHGFARAVFTAFGSIVGMLALIAASLAGLGALMLASETLFTVVKWVGAGYLVWLGIRLWRSPPMRIEQAPATDPAAGTPARAFLDGLFVALSNPKALLFFATFLPQFMQPDLALWLQFLIFGGTFAVVEFSCELAIAGAARRVAPWLVRNGRVFNRVTGGAFVCVGGMVATSARN